MQDEDVTALMKKGHNGHTCVYCGGYTFHNHCHVCGKTREEADASLQKYIDEKGEN